MILVIGRTGQVAREIARADPTARFLSREEADLADPRRAARAVATSLADGGVRAVINAAAYTGVDRAEEEEPLAHSVNAEAPGLIAQVCAARGVPLVHYSTDYVFAGAGVAPHSPGAPVAPLGAYGRTKAAGEAAVRAAGGPHAILRTSWVFSAHGANFLKTMLRLADTRDTLSIVADQIGGPTPAAALARAGLTVSDRLLADPALSGIYHLAGQPDVSWAGFARAIFAVAGRDVAVTEIPTSAYPTPAERPLNSRLDCTATEAALGVARPDWRAAIAPILTELAEAP